MHSRAALQIVPKGFFLLHSRKILIRVDSTQGEFKKVAAPLEPSSLSNSELI